MLSDRSSTTRSSCGRHSGRAATLLASAPPQSGNPSWGFSFGLAPLWAGAVLAAVARLGPRSVCGYLTVPCVFLENQGAKSALVRAQGCALHLIDVCCASSRPPQRDRLLADLPDLQYSPHVPWSHSA